MGIPRQAECHPKRQHYGHSLCYPCYMRDFHARQPACHPTKRLYARGLCRACYRTQAAEHGWGRRAECHPDKPNAGRGLCKRCYSATVRSEDVDRARRDVRNAWRKIRYGLSAEEFRANIIGQAGRCLVCGRVPHQELVVDHDHKTGEFRGLLCRNCNSGIGLLGDDLKSIENARRYLTHG